MAAVFRLSDYGKDREVVEVGQTISGKYKLLRLLGDGGMGSVYEAEHLRLGTHVAIKVLHSDLARRPGLMDRFLQEARVSAQIRSPHVVHVTDVDGTPEGVAFLVMELLQGEPLSNVVKRERQLSVGTACEYTLQILQALEAAHALGVIHRDLKPDNVFVTFEGGKPVLKLIDFGIAKLKRVEGVPGATKNLTVAGMLMGTPEYMAPEQAYSADKVDVRADLYSVGVMLYEMLAGQAPVSGDDPRIVVTKIERGEVTPLVNAAPGVQPALAGLVHRAMAPRPELRFASATEMRLALEGVASGKRSLTAALPAQAASMPPAGPSIPVELGTGTVMGAPASAALAPNMLGGGTVRAAPIDPAMAMMQSAPVPGYAQSPTPYEVQTPERRRGTGLIVGLAAIAALLGAGAVVAYVMQTEGGSSSGAVPTLTSTTTTAEAPTTPTTTAPATTSTQTTPLSVTSTPTLNPPPVTPVGPTPPRPSGNVTPPPSGSPAPSNTTPPPFVIPSGFPSAIPFPSGFPSTLPSGFPPIPSGFPWPPPSPKNAP